MYDEPVNNFSPCCTHYAATCCDLHGDRCKRAYDFAAPSFPRTERCEELLALLSCARCSSYAGHYDGSGHSTPLTARPNLTLCESFCSELWGACGRTFAPPAGAALDELHESSRAREFCVDQLGLRLPPPGDPHAPCFAGGRMASMPTLWLSAGVPLVLAAWHARQQVGS
mmetsp:Transcript_6855/g.16111  ORF Transcript_6855/g.16111 Transcript_6855/m.16111 type:complete len:170 (-) Transcript_6855:261-770(-)